MFFRNNKEAYPEPCREFTLKESFWFALTSFTPQVKLDDEMINDHVHDDHDVDNDDVGWGVMIMTMTIDDTG